MLIRKKRMIALPFMLGVIGFIIMYRVTPELSCKSAMVYAEECDRRYELIEDNEKEAIFYVEKIPRSKTLKCSDLTSDATHWKNTAWRDYYGVDMVIVEE